MKILMYAKRLFVINNKCVGPLVSNLILFKGKCKQDFPGAFGSMERRFYFVWRKIDGFSFSN